MTTQKTVSTISAMVVLGLIAWMIVHLLGKDEHSLTSR